ncbi:MAG: hypothetical protein QG670_1456 [Thermoproteota archaeon]|nr:hypothetical protein [Thermoproteota archaeon]
MFHHQHKKHDPARATSIIGIPKGALLHITLDILRSKQMSGSELTDEIEYYTDWRPSPGSIYPLFSKLMKQGFIEIVSSEDPSIKRYALTQKGEVFIIQEHEEADPHIKSHLYSTFKLYWRLLKSMNEQFFETYLELFKVIGETYLSLQRNPEALLKIQSLIAETTRKFQAESKQLKDI